MQKSFIKISSREVTASDLRAMLNSQIQILALTDLVEAARNSNAELDGKTCTEKFLTEVKKIIS